ncbi:PREDICTED: cellular tumor antigen p53-like [Nanorana parkeri]|uniref:cellular tumor antigen p53-like n=1 Tax=Nanorana parkeri TaxID=125878 RepID=UPI0008545F6B|nr:PREDICTED: cellular tumor antigen p53-like [Nanorana parkeri]
MFRSNHIAQARDSTGQTPSGHVLPRLLLQEAQWQTETPPRRQFDALTIDSAPRSALHRLMDLPNDSSMEPTVSPEKEDHQGLLPAVPASNFPEVGCGDSGSTLPTDITTLQEGERSTVTASQASAAPATEDYPGQQELQLEFERDGTSKSVMCKCSPELNKLFCQTSKTSPVLIHVKSSPYSGSVVPQTMKVYKKPEHIAEGVNRRPSNKSSVAFHNVFTRQSHLILIEENSMAHYTEDENGNHSANGPYEEPQVGSQTSNVLTSDMQNNTRLGEMNRRLIMTVTLESKDGILDQHRFHACMGDFPCKDHQMEGENVLKKEMKDSRMMAFPRLPTVLHPLFSIKHHAREEEVFTLKIRGRKRYKIFKKLNDALDLQDRRQAAVVTEMQVDGTTTGDEASDTRSVLNAEDFLASIALEESEHQT